MNKKYTKLMIILCIVFIVVALLFFFINKEVFLTENMKEKHSFMLEVSKISLEETKKETIVENYNKYSILVKARENAVTTPGTPFYSPDGWVSNFLGTTGDGAMIEIFNNSNETMIVDDNFIAYLGVNADDSPVTSKIEGGTKKIHPGESVTITVSDGGDAKYLKVGYGNQPKDWAFYPVQTFMDRVNIEEQLMYKDKENSDIYELDATISPHKFKSLNIGTIFSRKIEEKKYQGLSISNKEKKKYPYITLGELKIDIFNKTKETLSINSLDILYKENGKVINSDTINYNNYVYGNDCKTMSVPFKYLGNNITTTIVLKTNKGNITINQPELLFAVKQSK